MFSFAFVIAEAANPQGGFMSFLPMIAILVIAYLLILRPQMKKQKEHQKMLGALEKGDTIVTTGGIHGTIVRVNEEDGTMLVKVAENVKLVMDRGAVIRKPSTEVKE